MKNINTILKGSNYCILSGDVNKDGTISLSDVINIYNDANFFSFGYILTDVNDDNFTDLTDLVITCNNSASFETRISPPGTAPQSSDNKIQSNDMIQNNTKGLTLKNGRESNHSGSLLNFINI